MDLKLALPIYCDDPQYWDRLASANAVDSDQMPHNTATDKDLHCWPLTQQLLDTYQEEKNRLVQASGQK